MLWWVVGPVVWLLALALVAATSAAGHRKLGRAGLAVILALPVLSLGWCALRPDLLISPVDRFFMSEFGHSKDEPSKSLIPAVFQKGAPREQVVQILQRDGFTLGYGASLDDVWYTKDGPAFFSCSTTFRVQTTFDQSGLVDAVAERGYVCL